MVANFETLLILPGVILNFMKSQRVSVKAMRAKCKKLREGEGLKTPLDRIGPNRVKIGILTLSYREFSSSKHV